MQRFNQVKPLIGGEIKSENQKNKNYRRED